MPSLAAEWYATRCTCLLVVNLTMDVQVPYIPENAPLSPAQRAWLNGFLAGLFSQQAAAPQTPPKIRANVYFGTETGNSEAVAKQTAKFLQSRGFESQAINLSKISSSALANEAYALIVAGTFGDGDPPDSAKTFYTELHAPDHPHLPQLQYSVLALGDRNYERFCQCGKDIDARLEGSEPIDFIKGLIATSIMTRRRKPGEMA